MIVCPICEKGIGSYPSEGTIDKEKGAMTMHLKGKKGFDGHELSDDDINALFKADKILSEYSKKVFIKLKEFK